MENTNVMFEKSFKRPSYFFKLNKKIRYEIDKNIGILDLVIDKLSLNDIQRFVKHYDKI
jgi:hypothetical protein